MTENKRFRVTIGNKNDVRLVDYSDNRQLISISFKDYKDAVDCRDALLYQCNMMNKLHNENMLLKGELAYYKLLLMSLEKEAKRISKIR
jgi:hypothetical protein